MLRHERGPLRQEEFLDFLSFGQAEPKTQKKNLDEPHAHMIQ